MARAWPRIVSIICTATWNCYSINPTNNLNPQKETSVNLTENPEIVNWPETHYVFVEKVGPFMNTAPQAWQSAHTFVPELSEKNQITGYMSLYKVGPKIYRAGFALSAPPVDLPQGLTYE